MRNSKKIIAIILSLVFMISLCACTSSENGGTTTNYEGEGEYPYNQYDVTKYEVEDGAFEIEGELNLYKYDTLDDAEDVIDVLNDTFEINLKAEEGIDRSEGYCNWHWDNGQEDDKISASVSMSSRTGKFSFSYKPSNSVIYLSAKNGSVEEGVYDEKVEEFVKKFEFVTGKLTLEENLPVADMYYPYMEKGADDSQDLLVMGRRYFFVSDEYSKQTVDAQEGVSCYVECANSDVTKRDVQYFVVTVISDGTIVSADNYITKADIIPDGTQKMIDESSMEKLISYFNSMAEDDTLVLKRAYVESYSNYFGRPQITPTVKVEYYFKSEPDNVKTTDMALEGFYV